MKRIRTHTVPYTQEASIIQTCPCILDVYIPQGEPGENGKDGTNGVTPNITIGTTTTLPAGSNATVTETGTVEAPILNFGIPQGASGGGGVPLNYFDAWQASLTTTANGTIIMPTSVRHGTDDGISYDKTTGVVTLSTGLWFVQYGFTVNSATAQTFSLYMKQDGEIIPTSRLDQPLLANQPQTISRTFLTSASTNAKLEFISQVGGIQLSQINWFVKMLDA